MKQEIMTIVSQRSLAPRIFEMVLTGDLVQQMVTPGQFIHIRVPRGDLLLRRPISLAWIDQTAKTCCIIYRVEGEGTRVFSQLEAGAKLDVMGPLGNGFDISFVKPQQRILIIGGGIGVPPLYELSKQVTRKGAQVVHLFGYAEKNVIFYEEEFKQLGEVRYSTDDGSYGLHGHAGHLIQQALTEFQPDAVYACGSTGLLQAVENNFKEHPHAYLSLEARMACGMGACYACVCHLQGDETGAKSKKVCDEGPIFATGEVVL